MFRVEIDNTQTMRKDELTKGIRVEKRNDKVQKLSTEKTVLVSNQG